MEDRRQTASCSLLGTRTANEFDIVERRIMEYFYGGGGNSNPDFTYRFAVSEITNTMWKWCEDYPLTGPFERWHVRHNFKMGGAVVYPLVQIESRKAAYLFKIAFSEYIIQDVTYDFAKDDKWTS